jgi:hypothetical protein
VLHGSTRSMVQAIQNFCCVAKFTVASMLGAFEIPVNQTHISVTT